MNTLSIAERRKRLTSVQTMHFWQLLKTLSIQLDHHVSYEHSEPVLNLARTHQLSAYDSAYLNLAIKHHIPIATSDKKLITGAKACGIKIY